MAFLKNTISLLAVFCVVPTAFAATARPNVMNATMAVSATGAARRMPTVSSKVVSGFVKRVFPFGADLLYPSEKSTFSVVSIPLIFVKNI